MYIEANKKFKQKMSASRLLVEALILIAWAPSPTYCLCFIHAIMQPQDTLVQSVDLFLQKLTSQFLHCSITHKSGSLSLGKSNSLDGK